MDHGNDGPISSEQVGTTSCCLVLTLNIINHFKAAMIDKSVTHELNARSCTVAK